MNGIQVPELVTQIGEQQIELRMLRRQLAAATNAVQRAEEEVAALRAKLTALESPPTAPSP